MKIYFSVTNPASKNFTWQKAVLSEHGIKAFPEANGPESPFEIEMTMHQLLKMLSDPVLDYQHSTHPRYKDNREQQEFILKRFKDGISVELYNGYRE